MFASVCDDHWFFAANDLAALKALLDRVDHRGEKKPSLQANATFIDASRYLPNDYATFLFVDPRPFVEKLMPIVAMTGQALPMDQLDRLKSVRTVATSRRFRSWQNARDRFCRDAADRRGEKLERRYARNGGPEHFLLLSGPCFLAANACSRPLPPGQQVLPAALQQVTAALKGPWNCRERSAGGFWRRA